MSKENSTSYIYKENLAIALQTAIECRQKEEKKLGYNSDSTLVAGWKENLEAVRNGMLEIK